MKPVPDPVASKETASHGSGRVVLALVVLAVALRVAYVLLYRAHPRFDAPHMDAGYHWQWAQAMAAGTEFQDGPFFRAPLYPAWLAAMITVFGGEGTLAARLAQSLLGGLSAWLTFLLARRVVGAGAAVVAAGATALSWILIAFDAELLIPSLLVPLLLIALERAASWGGDDRPRAALTTGVAFGLAAIARPNVLLFMPILFAWGWRRSGRWRAPLALTLGTLMPVAPVTIQNALEGDTALIATQAGVNFWIGNNPASDGSTALVPGTRQGWFEGYRDAIAQAEAAEGRALKATEVSSYYLDRAGDWMISAPLAAARHMAWKAWLLGVNTELANNQDVRFTALRTAPWLVLSPVRWDTMLGFGLVGLVLAARRRLPFARMLLVFTGVYAVSIVLFFVTARFRVPLIPVLAVGAGLALVEIAVSLRTRNFASLGRVLVPSLLIALATHWNPAALDQSDANGLADLGRAELARGRPDQALEYFESAIRVNGSSTQVRIGLSAALVAAGQDPQRALRLLEEARSGASPLEAAELDSRILDLRVGLGDAASALAEAKRLLEERPGDGALRFVVARAEAAVGRPAAALQTLRTLVAAEPENSNAWLAVGQLEESFRRLEAAMAAYQAVLDLGSIALPAERERAQARLRALDRSTPR